MCLGTKDWPCLPSPRTPMQLDFLALHTNIPKRSKREKKVSVSAPETHPLLYVCTAILTVLTTTNVPCLFTVYRARAEETSLKMPSLGSRTSMLSTKLPYNSGGKFTTLHKAQVVSRPGKSPCVCFSHNDVRRQSLPPTSQRISSGSLRRLPTSPTPKLSAITTEQLMQGADTQLIHTHNTYVQQTTSRRDKNSRKDRSNKNLSFRCKNNGGCFHPVRGRTSIPSPLLPPLRATGAFFPSVGQRAPRLLNRLSRHPAPPQPTPVPSPPALRPDPSISPSGEALVKRPSQWKQGPWPGLPLLEPCLSLFLRLPSTAGRPWCNPPPGTRGGPIRAGHRRSPAKTVDTRFGRDVREPIRRYEQTTVCTCSRGPSGTNFVDKRTYCCTKATAIHSFP